MKKIDFKTKEKIVKSVEKLALAVGSTLGAGGRNALIQIGPQFAITKDGVTVARQIEFEDETENAVAQIVKEAAARTARDAGDGTTTSTVLVYEIVKNLLEREDFDKLNVTRVRAGIEEAANYLIASVGSQKKDVTTDDEIKSIATISGNNDPKIGDMMLEVFKTVGKEGAVRLEETAMNDTYIDVSDGCQIDSGFISQHFVNNTTRRVSDHANPMVFITDKKFETSFDELEPILNVSLKARKPLVIICGGMEGEPLGTLITNKMQGRIDVTVVQAPYFGTDRLDVLDDIAAITGGVVISEARGFNIEEVKELDFGVADRVIVDQFTTTILGRSGDEDKIKDRVEYVRNQQKEDKQGDMAWRYNQRLASLTSGVGVIYVGGNSEAEMKDMYYRLEDSLAATKAALNDGYVVGGGMAYFQASKRLHVDTDADKSYQIGFSAMLEAATKPVEWIMRNAGHVGSIPKGLGKKGYNAVTCTLSDLEKDGIIDPYKVVESCISNAASVAGMLITTNVIITDERRRK